MLVVLDAAILMLLIDADAPAPTDHSTGAPVNRCRERLEYLVKRFESEAIKALVPTPALAEVLVRASSAGPAIVEELSRLAVLRIVPFDTRAAIEFACMTREAIDAGDKKDGSMESWAKVKFDRQIIAIARVEGAQEIYTDDAGLRRFAQRFGFKVVGIVDLPLPPEDPQIDLF